MEDSDCWQWIAGKSSSGYGAFKHEGKQYRAHRFSYDLHKGAIPAGLMVLHKCDNPLCVNPEHLFLGTAKDNAEDRNAKNRQSTARGEAAATSKLKAEQVIAIRADNRKHLEIAKEYNVSRPTITRIKKGKTWKHL